MSIFKFKFFDVKQSDAPMRVGTDTMVLGASIDVFGKSYGLDVGAGTGVLSLMCAQRNSKIEIDAIELDGLASKECAYNFFQSNFFHYFHCLIRMSYTLLFINLPTHWTLITFSLDGFSNHIFCGRFLHYSRRGYTQF